ncbi:MAG: hypothetical protein HON70_43240, partial [Lentisphaerae bacterium]|nr:hypothetical protein [Lentisphaerota bacterium]
LTNQFPSTVAAAAHKAGAIGIISDCVCPPWLEKYPPKREPEDVPDLVMWTIFPGRRSDPPLFGFNLSPRQGRRLRALAAASDTPIRMHAMVDATLVEGSSDMVNASVTGTDLANEEVWVLGHLSEPGARDNASGCALSLEIARMLRVLTECGVLPPLRRTIRFMHGAEVSGFLPYIHGHRDDLPNVVAGLCADSIAQDFRICGGEAVLFLSPEQNASFVDGLMQYLLQTIHDEPASRFSPDNYATYPWHAEPYFGNDAFISDGFFDIPTPQISVWPDKFYHSNQDTPDQIDRGTLTRSAAVMGAFVYALAAADKQQASWFADLAAQDWKQRICLRTRDALSTDEPEARLPDEIHHMGLQAQDAVTQTTRFAPQSGTLQERTEVLVGNLAEFADREAQAARQSLGMGAARSAPETAPGDGTPDLQLIPRRLYWRLPGRDVLGDETDDAVNKLRTSQGADARRVWPWINGRRTVREIQQRLEFGGSVDVEPLLECLRLLEQADVISFAG